MYSELQELIGKKVERVFMSSDNLKFITDKGNLLYSVEGDCCSHSYFFDFYGVKNLLKNGVITDVKEVALHPNLDKDNEKAYESGLLKIYGFQITTESPEFGEVTSVVSFRNDSNGYYGGSMSLESDVDQTINATELFEDVIDITKNSTI